MSCIFCRIVAGEIPAEIVARGDGYTAFLDVHPLADGHVLVVPTAHVATIEELEPGDADALFRAARTLAGPTRTAVGAAGSIVGINNGEATGQTIPHVHVHIVPRWPNDGGGSIHTIFRPGTRRPVAEVGTAIRKAIERTR